MRLIETSYDIIDEIVIYIVSFQMNYSEIETPTVLIDLTVTKKNIKNYQRYCDDKGLNLRPHIKTHKIPELAKLQLSAGAVGITCQKVSEAEAMLSEGGIDDVLITYNIYGHSKLQRLLELSKKCNLSQRALKNI